MLKIAAVALLSAALVAEASSGAGSDWRTTAKALDNIPTAAGMSVLRRVNRCQFTILKEASFAETRNVAWPQYDAKAGQTVVKLVFKLPLYKGLTEAQNPPLEAVWIVDHGKTRALSHWAIEIQTKPIPMGYDKRLNC